MKQNIFTSSILAGALVAVLGTGVAVAQETEDRAPRGAARMLEQLDLNNDGSISAEELEQVQADRFAEIDVDADGFVSAEEIARAEELRRSERMISRLDQDEDGKLSAEEMARPDRTSRLMDADTDGDGAISQAELEAFAKEHGKDRRGDDKGKRKGPDGKKRDGKHGEHRGEGRDHKHDKKPECGPEENAEDSCAKPAAPAED